MIGLGLILALLGYLVPGVPSVVGTIGVILLVVGAVLLLLGRTGTWGPRNGVF